MHEARREQVRLGLAPTCMALLLTLAGTASAGEASGLSADVHHAAVDALAYPWASVGKLFNSVGGACTASVLAPDKVLTAAHCLYAFRTRRFLPASAIHVLFGYDRGTYRVHARVSRYRIGAGFNPERERQTAGADQAVLLLTVPLPAAVRPLAIPSAAPGAGTSVVLGGFGQERAYVMTADTQCAVTGRIDSDRILLHDCRIEPGESGAPLLVLAGGGAYQAVAVVVGTFKVANKQVGIAAVVSPDLLASP